MDYMIFVKEMRDRVFYLCCSVFFTFHVGYQHSLPLVYILSRPLILIHQNPEDFHSSFLLTNVTEAFWVTIESILFFEGFILFPLCLYQIWAFIVPGVYFKERRIIQELWFRCLMSGIFGLVLCYYVIIPFMWAFFLTFQIDFFPFSLLLQAKMKTYCQTIQFFLGSFFFLFSLLPLLVYILIHFDFLNEKNIKVIKNHKWVILFSVGLASFFSPPDIWSQLILSFLCFSLFELFLLFLIWKKIMVESKKMI